MDISDVIRSCLRRWYVFIPLLAITGWYAHGYYSAVVPVYYSNAVVGITAPNQQMQLSPDGSQMMRNGNGLLDIGGAGLIMNMAVLGFGDPSVRAQVVAGGGKGNFTARMFPSEGLGAQTQLPLIMIEATEPDAASASRTVELAAAQTNRILHDIQLQAGVSEAGMVRAIDASRPATVAGVPSRNKRFLLILAVGFGLAIVAAVGVDVLAQRLGTRPRKDPTHKDTEADPSDTDSRQAGSQSEPMDGALPQKL